MQKKKPLLLIVLFFVLLFAVTTAFYNSNIVFFPEDSKISVLMNQKIELKQSEPQDKNITPLFFNFLSKLFYKFAQ